MKSAEIALIVSCLVVMCALLSGCSMPVPPTENATQIKVLVTVLPEAGYVQAVGGDRVKVFVAVPPGADPHTYEPSARDMVEFSEADIYFSLGKGILPFEDNLVSKLSSMNPRMRVIETARGIDLLTGEDQHNEENLENNQDTGIAIEGHSHDGPDPHIWVSLNNSKIMVNHIYDALATSDPAYASYYKDNRDSYLKNLTSMDTNIRTILENAPGKQFISSHASWGYFARDYGLTQVVIGQPGKEATSKEIETLIREARDNGITIIVSEPEYSRKTADIIANSINGRVVTDDPLSRDIPGELKKLATELSGDGNN